MGCDARFSDGAIRDDEFKKIRMLRVGTMGEVVRMTNYLHKILSTLRFPIWCAMGLQMGWRVIVSRKCCKRNL